MFVPTIVIPPAGLSEAGTFAPVETEPFGPSPGVLADSFDLKAKDFKSITKGMHPVDAAFQMQLATIRGAGIALADQGSLFSTFEYATSDIAARIRKEVDRIAAPFVAAKDIEIIEVRTDGLGDDGAAALVVYRNLRTNKKEEATV